MIAEEVTEITSDFSMLARQEKIARKNWKLHNWLKLLSLHTQNKDTAKCRSIIREDIH